ncbi:hypothetical protein GCM10011351_23650 [Paraliobacillus quinghaiensis]|uniref:G5 domain-containing protein n=1 Tax=Paraliobacillus quinghaiensis TaxID=470815 RepID=A0A917TT88_9BACI|nr:G5 and 3D domain-containing protein [Paraliobacillus quinghaiensis]GGM36773.1 hypothetical protein GCM10011351_23650 [Paraliobacillus quinghaiensis]
MKNLLKLLPMFQKKVVISVLSVAVLFLFVGFVVYEATEIEVSITQDGEKKTVNTHADTVADLLEELDLTVGEHDALSHDFDEIITADMSITYKKANKIVLTIGDQEKTYRTTKDTVEEFLEEKEIAISEHDVLSVEESTAIEDDTQITLDKAVQVTINDGGNEKQVWTTEDTVSDLLSQESIELNELDRLEPEETVDVTSDTAVTITRVEKVTDIVEEKIDYSTVTKKDNNLTEGKKKVVDAGETGLVEKKYEVTLENGEEVERKLVSEEVKKESKKRVVAVGTKKIQQFASRSGDDISGKTLYMKATAYTAECTGCSGITRTGINLNKDRDAKVIAVDPNVIPLGTKVWVEGYGNAIAGDTGGAIKGNRIDIHVPTKSEAYRFGVRNVKVKILE